MMSQDVQTIILAAGKSNRFNTGRSKLLEKICGQEMILFPTKLLAFLHIDTTLVVGHKREEITEIVTKHHGTSIRFAIQEEQLGTGHALLCSQPTWEKEHILILNGDMPLISQEIIKNLYDKHKETNAELSFISAHYPEPSAYGRVVKKEGRIKIIEAKDLTGDDTEHCCINAGIYLIKKTFLMEYVHQIESNNQAQEFYLTDLVELASQNNYRVEMIEAPFDSIRGINTLKELWAAEHIKRSEIIDYWMSKGVRFSKAHTIHIDLNVTIGSGTVVGQAVQFIGTTTIGKNCIIEPFAILENMVVKNDTIIHAHTILKNSRIDESAIIGPFTHIHDACHIGKNTTIGNFCEITQSVIGEHTQAEHMVYIGNAHIGSHVFIGAGTFTSNFDGKKNQETTIKDHALLKGNNQLIAPVVVGEHVCTHAGSILKGNISANEMDIDTDEKYSFVHQKEGSTAQTNTPPIFSRVNPKKNLAP